ncbi:hypothetical protein C2G38_2099618 [Gigaspora rosea]|uniref:Uncharacterized protein n=1 Tax=Gigaspora rosea TaxID=44941 RepID=A0A397UZD7_9GLOM|nr:hypothetical protein C2G38_2099618 [Gigaspora rosea]
MLMLIFRFIMWMFMLIHMKIFKLIHFTISCIRETIFFSLFLVYFCILILCAIFPFLLSYLCFYFIEYSSNIEFVGVFLLSIALFMPGLVIASNIAQNMTIFFQYIINSTSGYTIMDYLAYLAICLVYY